MKIMILAGPMGSGGAQTHIFELARGLMKKGHGIILISSGGHFEGRLARLGARCYRVCLEPRRPISVLAAMIALRAIIARERPDIVHAHTRAFGAICRAMGLGRPTRSPVYVSTVHAHFDTDGIRGRLPWYSGASIAVSEDLKQYLLDVSNGALLPERIEVIPNGVDTERFRPAKKRGERPSICFMSRLDADCSHTAHLLCELAERINALFGAQIFIIGGGSELESLRIRADAANRRIGRLTVRMLGELDAPERVISRSDAFIGVSRAALEAMSCGVPVILSGNEGFFGLVRSRDDLERASAANFCCRGLDIADGESLMQSICELFSMDKASRKALGARLCEFVRQNNSLSVMVDKSERFYKRELAKNKENARGGTLLCGYYGFDNLGDNALLSGAVKRAGSATVLSSRPRRTAYKFGVRCVSRADPIAVMREIRRCKKFVFGGGSLLQSSTSFRSLCFYSALLTYAARRGKRVELWANGLGGFRGRISEKMAARALESADRIGLRDGGSVLCARGLIGGSDKVVLEADLSELTLAASEQRVAFLLSGAGASLENGYAVVAPRGVRPISMLRPSYRRAARRDIRALCAELLELRRRRIRAVFVPMYPRRDGEMTRMICAAFGGYLLEGIGADDLLGIVSGAESVVSMRYHALLFALRCGVPATAIGDDPKLRLNF